MKIEVRLRRVLQEYGIREHGAQVRLAKYLGVDRQAVGRIINNHCNRLSLESIEGLCRWLLQEVDPRRRNELRKQLPGVLFSMAGLWERMFQSVRVTTYLGEKVLGLNPRGRVASTAWVSSMDVAAALQITQRLASEESAALHVTQLVSFHKEQEAAAARTKTFEEKQAADRRRAGEIFERARRAEGETALVVGSQKVNMLCELLCADFWGVAPFEAPSARKAPPVYVSYRDTDPPVPTSCFGGHDAPPGLRGRPSPGIYHRGEDGKWRLAPWERGKSTAGLILVSNDTSRDAVEVVLFGFCAQGTRLLGDVFCESPDEFWPEQVNNGKDRRFGAFVVEIDMEGDELAERVDARVLRLPERSGGRRSASRRRAVASRG